MTELLSGEARKMCRPCEWGKDSGRCDILNRRVDTQNRLADNGMCPDAAISGHIWGTSTRESNFVRINVNRVRDEDGRWHIKSKMPATGL